MTKEKLKSIEALVKELLENNERTRSSDNFLYLCVLYTVAERINFDLNQCSVPYFLGFMKLLGFPPFETVRRSRQKLQRKFPELRANNEVADRREDNEKVFREYAREEVC